MKISRRAVVGGCIAASLARFRESTAAFSIFQTYNGNTSGWTTVAPVQPVQTPSGSGSGSRQIYVSSSTGNDSTGDGTIGNPWATPTKGFAAVRTNSSDQIFFKCGDTWNTGLSGSAALAGNAMTGTPGGTITGPILISYYGTGNRPLFQVSSGNFYGDFPSSGTNGQNIAIIGLEAYCPINDPGSGSFTGSSQQIGITNDNLTGTSVFLVEDCEISFFAQGINWQTSLKQGEVWIRRNLIHDNVSSAVAGQGIYLQSFDSAYIQDNFLYRNGWNPNAAFSAVNYTLCRNVYIQTAVSGDPSIVGYNNCSFTGNISLYSSSEGLQLRQGGTCYNNLFARNIAQDIGHATNGSTYLPPPNPVSVTYNIVVNASDLPNGTVDEGVGFNLANLPNGGTFQHNIICHGVSATPSGQYGFQTSSNGYATTGCTVTNNIIYNMGGAGNIGNGVQDTQTGNTDTPNAYEGDNLNSAGYQAAVTNTDLIGYVFGHNLGGVTSTLAAYIAAVLACKQPQQWWSAGYGAASINNFIRQIFNQPTI